MLNNDGMRIVFEHLRELMIDIISWDCNMPTETAPTEDHQELHSTPAQNLSLIENHQELQSTPVQNYESIHQLFRN